MVRHDVLTRRLAQMRQSLDKIKRYRTLSYEEYLRHDTARDVVEYNLFICLNMMIDIVNHIVTDEQLGAVDFLSDGFAVLQEHGIITAEQYRKYVQMIGFRNVLAHEYINVDSRIVYNVLQHGLADIEEFMALVEEKYL